MLQRLEILIIEVGKFFWSVDDFDLIAFLLKGMMEQSKRASLSVARSILNHKLIGKKLESYLKVCRCVQHNCGPQNTLDLSTLTHTTVTQTLLSL